MTPPMRVYNTKFCDVECDDDTFARQPALLLLLFMLFVMLLLFHDCIDYTSIICNLAHLATIKRCRSCETKHIELILRVSTRSMVA